MASDFEPVPVTPQKHDPAWKHCQMYKNGDKVLLKCVYCGKTFKGGGIHRIKEHLAGQKGNASTCLRVPPDIRLLMQESLDGVVIKKRKKQKITEEIIKINPIDESDSFAHQSDMNFFHPSVVMSDSSFLVSQEEGTVKKLAGRKRRGRPRNESPLSVPEGVPISGVTLGLKRVSDPVHMAIGRFLYDVGVPLGSAANSVYFQPMIDAIASHGPGVIAPSCHDLRGWILKNTVEEVKTNIDHFTETWGRTGCSLLADEWISKNGETLLNFSVYCPEGTMFLKSVDITETKNSSDALFETLKEAVELVGVRNVLQVITSGNEPYIIAGGKLNDTFPSLYWAPCAAHCIDLMLGDFGELEWIHVVLEQARSITRFIYNHSLVLNMMRRHTCGSDVIQLGVTRSATNFLTLKRMLKLRQNLQEMVASQEWMECTYSKKPEGLLLVDLLSDQSFWSSIHLVIRLVDPLLRVLSIVGSEKRPAMGYVYAGIYRAKETIKEELDEKKGYLAYWNIIDFRWKQLRRLPLHAAGFYLNPKFFYSIEGDIHNGISTGLFDCIERLVADISIQDKIVKERNFYIKAMGDLRRKMAIRARDFLLPGEWWSTYGGGCPNLSRLAVRVLSQTCSLICHRQNWISLEQIHSTRNCLEKQRLIDLAFVRYNLQPRQAILKSKGPDCVDPISNDSISFAEDWIAQKNMCLEDYGCSEWMTVDPPLVSNVLLGPSNDDAAELGVGFDDSEIFDDPRDGKEEDVEVNVNNVNQVQRHDCDFNPSDQP